MCGYWRLCVVIGCDWLSYDVMCFYVSSVVYPSVVSPFGYVWIVVVVGGCFVLICDVIGWLLVGDGSALGCGLVYVVG